MKRLAAASVTLAVFVLPGLALAQAPTPAHLREYRAAYHQVARQFGRRAPGCSLVESRGSCHLRASDGAVMASLGVLDRMLAPPPPPTPIATQSTAIATQSTGATPYAVARTQYAAPQSTNTGGLAACIISRESGGNRRASNGLYSGIAQWSPTSWANGGGTRYASSPAGASYSQQVAVLNSMLANGQAGQWTPYDGC